VEASCASARYEKGEGDRLAAAATVAAAGPPPAAAVEGSSPSATRQVREGLRALGNTREEGGRGVAVGEQPPGE
jgi:hypothetical protein